MQSDGLKKKGINKKVKGSNQSYIPKKKEKFHKSFLL